MSVLSADISGDPLRHLMSMDWAADLRIRRLFF
jgi:hypothetical protein